MPICYDIKVKIRDTTQIGRFYGNRLQIVGQEHCFFFDKLTPKFCLPFSLCLHDQESREKIHIPARSFVLAKFFPYFYSLLISTLLIAIFSFTIPLVLYARISWSLALAAAFFSLFFNLLFVFFFVRGTHSMNQKSLVRLFMGQSLLAALLLLRFPYLIPIILFFYTPCAISFLGLIVFHFSIVLKKTALMLLWFFLLFANFQVTSFFFVTSLDIKNWWQFPYHNFEVSNKNQQTVLQGDDGYSWKVHLPLRGHSAGFFSYLLPLNFSQSLRESIAPQLLISRPKLLLSYFTENNIGYAGVFSNFEYPSQKEQAIKTTLIHLQQVLLWKQPLFWSRADHRQKIQSGFLSPASFENLKTSNAHIFWQQIPMQNILRTEPFSLCFLFFQAQHSSYVRFWIFDLPQNSSPQLAIETILSGMEKD